MWGYVVVTWDQIHKFLNDPAIQSICAILALFVPIQTFIYKRIKENKLYKAFVATIQLIVNVVLCLLLPVLEFNGMSWLLNRKFLPFDVSMTIFYATLYGAPVVVLLVLVAPYVPGLLNRLRSAYSSSSIGKTLKRPFRLWVIRISILEAGVIVVVQGITAFIALLTALENAPKPYETFDETGKMLIQGSPDYLGSFFLYFFLYSFLSMFVILGLNLFVRLYLHKDKNKIAQKTMMKPPIKRRVHVRKRYISIEEREARAQSSARYRGIS